MQRAAIGVRMHSGWGVLVAVAESAGIIERCRIDVISDDRDARQRGNQPYHRAAELGVANAEKYLAEYTVETERLAREAIGKAIAEMKKRGYHITAAALLLPSARKLPPLPQILASHPLIRTAEGELFRATIRRACESLGVPVLGLVSVSSQITLRRSSAPLLPLFSERLRPLEDRSARPRRLITRLPPWARA